MSKIVPVSIEINWGKNTAEFPNMGMAIETGKPEI